mgnify:CR=1 FL=1
MHPPSNDFGRALHTLPGRGGLAFAAGHVPLALHPAGDSSLGAGDAFDGQEGRNDLSPDLLLENVVPIALPVQVPFTGFDGIDLSVAYPGWNESSSLQPVTGSSSWTASTNLGAANNITASFNYNLNNNVSYIVGPKVTAAFNTFVSFDLALTDASAIFGNGEFDPDDRFSLMISEDCGFTFTEVLVFEFGDLIGNQLTNFEYFLGDYEGQDIILAFKADDGVGDGTAFNLHLDNINLFNSTQEKIALIELVTPVQSSCYSDQEEVQVRVRNTGFVPLDFAALHPCTPWFQFIWRVQRRIHGGACCVYLLGNV